MKCLYDFSTPQLEKIHKGKVRDSIKIDDDKRMIVVTDRLSAFDKVLKSPIRYKGAVLNGISNFWFDKTKNIIPNHLIKQIDPNISLVKEVKPVKVEMIIRGYLTGSMWRGYQKGKRLFSGVQVEDGMKKNQAFKKPIATPTTKEEIDREITPENIVKENLVSEDMYKQMKETALKLFDFGTKYLEDKGIILVDTKYEFGLLDEKLILIDEIHTPDSSRFWYKEDYEKNQENVEQIDKEYTRQWLLNNRTKETYPVELPEEVVEETSKRYLEIYKRITDTELEIKDEYDINQRIYTNLVKEQIIKEGYIAVIMGSPSDEEHCRKIKSYIDEYDIATDLRVVSAHKNGEEITNIVEEYNDSIEPGAVIAVAGRSNGLGGALSANLNIPVFNCPPFKDKTDMQINLNSSLMMPSKTPAATVVHPDNVAYASLRSLNLPRLRYTFSKEIKEMKTSLKENDKKMRGR
ncbi:MAG: phosphoribosylaminoimidazolesuccinocarboxamide synthase [Spirochaetota bacterium]